MIFLAPEGCFWPLTASMTSEVKKNHAHVYPYRNLRKFSEIIFSIGCMVWPWIAVWVCQDILRLLIRSEICVTPPPKKYDFQIDLAALCKCTVRAMYLKSDLNWCRKARGMLRRPCQMFWDGLWQFCGGELMWIANCKSLSDLVSMYTNVITVEKS